jgi:hypothetical protein
MSGYALGAPKVSPIRRGSATQLSTIPVDKLVGNSVNAAGPPHVSGLFLALIKKWAHH